MNIQPINISGSSVSLNPSPPRGPLAGRSITTVTTSADLRTRSRDDTGGSTDIGDRRITLYHGCSESAANSIKKYGFQIALKSGGMSSGLPPGLTHGMKEASDTHHHFTVNKKTAADIAKPNSSGGEGPAVLKLVLTQTQMAQLGLEPDVYWNPNPEKNDALRTRQDIPAKYVQDASPLPSPQPSVESLRPPPPAYASPLPSTQSSVEPLRPPPPAYASPLPSTQSSVESLRPPPPADSCCTVS